MAISLGKFKQEGARQSTSKRLAKEYEKQQKKESKRKGWSSFLGGVGGKLLGAGLVGLTGATGGLAAPLLMAAGSFGAKKLAHEATKGMGAKTGKLVGDKYGYGKAEATTLREGLEQQLKESDPTKQRGAFGGELLGAYASAGMAGDLGGAKTILKGGEGSLMEGMTGQQDWLGGIKGGDIGGWGGVKSELGSLLDTSFLDEEGDEVLQKAQGGLVPNKAPSIVEYFSMQGKTLGGSNTKSLSQMIGRS